MWARIRANAYGIQKYMEKNPNYLVLSGSLLTTVDNASNVDQNAPFTGGVPEWPKGSDCKSDGSAFGGSNPPPSTRELSMVEA